MSTSPSSTEDAPCIVRSVETQCPLVAVVAKKPIEDTFSRSCLEKAYLHSSLWEGQDLLYLAQHSWLLDTEVHKQICRP
ncbi:hypothetical protein TNCV_3109451 [Trichonephila clavipes]|nr:hypothetical protein TNCV_3109451 [Trichonephila clavipes]